MSKARILIIDDHLDVRAEVKERIESLGHESDEATCQEQALAKLHDLQFDLALLDLAIPLKHDGVARIEHGKNLLQRIVALPSPPPVVVITSNGEPGHKRAVEMMELGAKSFVAKPFDDDELESKIQKVLATANGKPVPESSALKPFEGGSLVLNEGGIELCGVLVGGIRGNSIIRAVVERLAIKKDDKYVKASAQTLATSITSSLGAPSLTSAINDFRIQCTEKLRLEGVDCGKDGVIHTAKGGGYQFREWIEVRLGREDVVRTEADEDCEIVMRIFNRHKKRTVKQVRDAVEISAVRTKAAMTTLESRGKIKNTGGSGSTTVYALSDKGTPINRDFVALALP